MFDFNMNRKFMNRFFRPVDSVVWDMMSGNIGVKNDNGILTCSLGELSEDGTEAISPEINVNLFDQFGMSVPAFAQSVPVNTISLGDIIYSSSSDKIIEYFHFAFTIELSRFLSIQIFFSFLL